MAKPGKADLKDSAGSVESETSSPGKAFFELTGGFFRTAATSMMSAWFSSRSAAFQASLASACWSRVYSNGDLAIRDSK